ncbi:MAG: hypothetical protein LC722_03575 [Actinobacteria bacterium]|nr:hypothetical protein [Actinomycetota bacterium]
MSTATKVLGGALVLYLIFSFFAWNDVCSGGGTVSGIAVPKQCASDVGALVSLPGLWSGVGVIAGLLAIALLVEEILKVLSVKMPPTLPIGTVVLGMAAGVFVFTLLRVLIKPGFGGAFGFEGVKVTTTLFGWLGLLLSLAVLYGGYMRFQEAKAAPGIPPAAAAPPPPPPPAGGGFTS